jgi:hypothetical protein
MAALIVCGWLMVAGLPEKGSRSPLDYEFEDNHRVSRGGR